MEVVDGLVVVPMGTPVVEDGRAELGAPGTLGALILATDDTGPGDGTGSIGAGAGAGVLASLVDAAGGVFGRVVGGGAGAWFHDATTPVLFVQSAGDAAGPPATNFIAAH